MSATKPVTTASQGGAHLTYHVEVRARVGVCHMQGQSYGTEWVQYIPERSCIPPSALYWMDQRFGLLTYPAAMAVAWMVTAYAESFAEMSALGMEARVVESRVEFSYQATRVRALTPIEHRAQPPAPERPKETP